jgi:hypothetical protein
MTINKSLTPKFFENLGKLYFAIASADKRVEDAEIKTLKEIVLSYWQNIDALNSDAIQHIEFTFQRLHKEAKLSSNLCYQDFIAYKNKHHHLFTDAIKKLILQTSNAIASSFSGKNKSELIILAKLDIEFKK